MSISGKMKRVKLGSRISRGLRGRSRGFSLIEVVIAIALLGIIGATILSALSTATLALIIADQRATAESLTRTQMESIKNEKPYIDYSEPGHGEYKKIEEDPEHYGIDITVEPINPDTYEPYPYYEGEGRFQQDEGIQLITVTVTYYTLRGDNAPREQTYTLEDYKVGQGIEE